SFAIGAGGGFTAASTGVSILDNQWHHIADVYTSNSIQMYLDGVLKSMTPLTAPPANNTRDLYFGTKDIGDTRRYNGLLDEVAIYDRALSRAEVKARWSALAPATKPVGDKVGEIRHFGVESHKPRRLALSPDGQRLLTAGCIDGTARYWDIATGKEIYR